MEISQVITGMILFVMVMFIADLYIEVKELKRRPKGAGERAEKSATGKNLLGIIAEMETEINEKDKEIGNLKAELNKVKFDYACEVAGKK